MAGAEVLHPFPLKIVIDPAVLLYASFLGGSLRRIRAAGANEAYTLGPSGALVAASGAGDAPAGGGGPTPILRRA